MDKSSRTDIPLEAQRDAWNRWNAEAREHGQGRVSRRQADLVESWLDRLGRTDLDIVDVGCGAGWMCGRLLRYGRVTGIDMADEVVERAQRRLPQVSFVAGDFMTLDLGERRFDVAVALEVLSHVADQPAFLRRTCRLLKSGGVLMLATQNRPVLERWSKVGMPVQGQLRRWLDPTALRRMLARDFELIELTSLEPVGDQGFLRLVNSTKLNRLLAHVIGAGALERAKERWLLGHTLMALARKRGA